MRQWVAPVLTLVLKVMNLLVYVVTQQSLNATTAGGVNETSASPPAKRRGNMQFTMSWMSSFK
jgi:hypothetical protein